MTVASGKRDLDQASPLLLVLSGRTNSVNRNSLWSCFQEAGVSLPTIRSQLNVPRPRPNIPCFPSCLHSPAAHMATAQHCAGRRAGQRRALIGAEETAAPQPQEVHCGPPSSTQSGAVKAAVTPVDKQTGLWGVTSK